MNLLASGRPILQSAHAMTTRLTVSVAVSRRELSTSEGKPQTFKPRITRIARIDPRFTAPCNPCDPWSTWIGMNVTRTCYK